MNPFGKSLLILLTALAAVPAVANDYRFGIVKIQTQLDDPGSGFILGPDRKNRCVLVTAKHVIAEHQYAQDKNVRFYFPDGTSSSVFYDNFFFDEDTNLDLAAAKVPCGKNIVNLPLAKASSIAIANPIIVAGYPTSIHNNGPMNATTSIARGVITKYSSAGDDAADKGYNISYDAKTQVGFSGGPVLSDDSSKIIAVHGYTFAVQTQPVVNPDGTISGDLTREERRVGGSGITSAILYKFLLDNGYKMPRARGATCLVGVC